MATRESRQSILDFFREEQHRTIARWGGFSGRRSAATGWTGFDHTFFVFLDRFGLPEYYISAMKKNCSLVLVVLLCLVLGPIAGAGPLSGLVASTVGQSAAPSMSMESMEAGRMNMDMMLDNQRFKIYGWLETGITFNFDS